MRRMHCLPQYIPVVALLLLPLCAHADSLVLGLDESSGDYKLGANTTLSQDVLVSQPTRIDGIAFYVSDPSGAPLTYSITDLTTDSTLFTETFDDTTLDPALTNIAIPEGVRGWLEVYMPTMTLAAGSDTYQFSLSGAGNLKVGVDPTSTFEDGLAPAGGSVLGLRVYAITPEPDALILLGTGTAFLAIAGVKRRQWMH